MKEEIKPKAEGRVVLGKRERAGSRQAQDIRLLWSGRSQLSNNGTITASRWLQGRRDEHSFPKTHPIPCGAGQEWSCRRYSKQLSERGRAALWWPSCGPENSYRASCALSSVWLFHVHFLQVAFCLGW